MTKTSQFTPDGNGIRAPLTQNANPRGLAFLEELRGITWLLVPLVLAPLP